MALTVVVVNDEAGIRNSLDGCLSDGGYRVVLAGHGEQALELLSRTAADAVLLDVRLPGMGGLETLGRIREAFPLLPVVMISGNGTIDMAVRAVKEGAFDFIEKPVFPEKLLIVLSRALEQRDLRVENLELKERDDRRHRKVADSPAPFDIGDFRQATLAFEKGYLERKLRENDFNVSRTAERLGLDRTSIHRKMKQLGIPAAGGRR
jgi:two-component system nitrogen regulation response regulator NtrX